MRDPAQARLPVTRRKLPELGDIHKARRPVARRTILEASRIENGNPLISLEM
jgi:hypothetical protein